MGVMSRGVDISSHQHPNGAPIDFAQVKADSWDFVTVKATEGATYVNPYFAADARDAAAAGLQVDAYHWVSPVPAADQVANVLRTLKSAGFRGRVWLDFEEDGATHAILDAVRAGLQSAGLSTGTYTYPAFWKANGDSLCWRCAADPLWYAWQRPEEPTPDAVKAQGFSILPWQQVTIWQYAGTSVAIPGISGLNDANQMLTPSPSPTPAQPPIEQNEDRMDVVRDKSNNRCYLRTSTGELFYIPDGSPDLENEQAKWGPLRDYTPEYLSEFTGYKK